MLECNRYVKKKMTLLTRYTALTLVVVCIVLLLSQTVFARNTYLINDGENVMVYTTYATDPAQILTEAGLQLGKEDTYITQNFSGMSEITVQRQQAITIIHAGKIIKATSYGETVGALLRRLNLILLDSDIVSVPMDTLTYNGMVLQISRATQTQQTYTEVLPRDVIYCYDATLPQGDELVLTEGSDGEILCTATVNFINGKEISRTVTSQVVTKQPVSRVVAVGTYVEQNATLPMPEEPSVNFGSAPIITGNTIITADGKMLTFTECYSMVATAYSCNGEPGITYSGTPARVGAIAVDPTVIPLGTRMFILTNDGQYIYGEAVAEDIGGSIKGYKVDLYFETFDECWIFGVRDCTVYILA